MTTTVRFAGKGGSEVTGELAEPSGSGGGSGSGSGKAPSVVLIQEYWGSTRT